VNGRVAGVAAEGLAPAKVNLALGVVGRRADGYHELISVFARLALADRLSVEIGGDPGTVDRLDVGGTAGHVATDLDLVLRAAAALRAHAGRPLPALRFTLEKRIPVAAGLGGGSSDAATALELAAAAWGLAPSLEERLDLAARLGSDVPFFAVGAAAALVEGRGERIRPLPPPGGDPAVLLVTADARLSTAVVFRAFAAAAEGGAGPVGTGSSSAAATARDLAAALEAGLDAEAFAGWAPRLRDANDLWPAAAGLLPELAELRGTLEGRLGRPVLLSGSGPTLVALYPSQGEADAGRRRLAGLRGARITVTTLGDGQRREAS
jgi:4-diphosphocytidyl-2-C-methyl-D-erythritol kinase